MNVQDRTLLIIMLPAILAYAPLYFHQLEQLSWSLTLLIIVIEF